MHAADSQEKPGAAESRPKRRTPPHPRLSSDQAECLSMTSVNFNLANLIQLPGDDKVIHETARGILHCCSSRHQWPTSGGAAGVCYLTGVKTGMNRHRPEARSNRPEKRSEFLWSVARFVEVRFSQCVEMR